MNSRSLPKPLRSGERVVYRNLPDRFEERKKLSTVPPAAQFVDLTVQPIDEPAAPARAWRWSLFSDVAPTATPQGIASGKRLRIPASAADLERALSQAQQCRRCARNADFAGRTQVDERGTANSQS